jgi:transglutaminase-like putative cysteine protease
MTNFEKRALEARSATADNPRRWLSQTEMSDPRQAASMLEGLPQDVSGLCRVVQGALIHLEWIGAYGLSEHDLAHSSRDTLSLADRLGRLADSDSRPLLVQRPASARAAGTCRDFALMLCGLLRHQHVPARVRCGFAAYFREARWEDHWICEYWLEAERRWRRVDAQLDEVLVARLGVKFDPADLPHDAFMTADEAWRCCRAGREAAETFGHGAASGLWFIRVNVMRDHLVLNGAEVSAWDTWRNATAAQHALSDDELQAADAVAEHPMQIARANAPPWIA